MNENENITPEVEEDEISLLDLFAVLIKYRILIVVGTLLVFAFTCLKLFILPLFGDNITRGVSIEYRIAVKQLPLSIEQKISSEKNLGIGYSSFLSCNTEPFIIPQPLGRAKKTIIVTFATFFVLVFIAFLLKSIENIKKDPEASELIKNAWDGGKIFKKK